MSNFLVRPMTAADLPAVLHVQARCYRAELVESGDALASRLALSPSLCWVAVTDVEPRLDASLAGYLFSHAWPEHSLPPWNGLLAPDACLGHATLTWFVHDMAVAPAGRGAGLARRLLDSAAQAAVKQGLGSSRLVAVQAAAEWWARGGYEALQPGALAMKLAAYGEDAVLMGRAFPSPARVEGQTAGQ